MPILTVTSSMLAFFFFGAAQFRDISSDLRSKTDSVALEEEHLDKAGGAEDAECPQMES